jgi:hypothetical protein
MVMNTKFLGYELVTGHNIQTTGSDTVEADNFFSEIL